MASVSKKIILIVFNLNSYLNSYMWLLATILDNAMLGFEILGKPKLEDFLCPIFLSMPPWILCGQTWIVSFSPSAVMTFIAVWPSFALCVGGRKQSRRAASIRQVFSLQATRTNSSWYKQKINSLQGYWEMYRTTGKTKEPDWGSCSQDSGLGQMVTVYIIDTANINH